MKKIVSLALALCLATAAIAGNNNKAPFLSLGVKAGISSENMKMESVTWGNIKDATAGYHAGIVLRMDFPVIPIYFQPELLYNWSKIKSDASPENIGDIKFNNFNVPLMIGFGIGSSNLIMLRANVGPVLNLMSDVKIAEADGQALRNAFKKPTVTWAAGIGLDIINITFDVRYNGQFSKTKVNDGQDGTIISKPQSWTFSLGYLF